MSSAPVSSAAAVASIGVDFGTSNTVVALVAEDGSVETLRFEHGGTRHSVYATALCFQQERAGLPPSAEGGPWAIERLVEAHSAVRFVQSFKTFAASAAFQTTQIFQQRYTFQDLLAAFLRTLTRHAGPRLDLGAPRVVVGRPVTFAGANPDEALAMERYRDAFGRLGAAEAHYVFEPVGAAFSYGRRLDRDATVLVADFGGGTSDFSIIRFARHGGRLKAEALGSSGIGVAGDTFDARIVERVVAPRLGRGGSYRSFGKVLPLPTHYYTRLTRWNELAMMKGSGDLRELRELARSALEPEPLEDFITLVEMDLGFSLYRSVSAAKVALSAEDQVDFRFADGGVEIGSTIRRADFEQWIADDLTRISATVDRVLAETRLAPAAIDRVFLTGGTSFVPAVQALFADRFGVDKLVSADQFEAIATGLALIGASEEPARWAVAA
ncbi:Hsp70 family protein [Methyloraptor flagellatus]|uniref:Hsp70 family protein n=1 Tax=Methyloraptor flagellatus TaxID=3162530 RepID=A0AAU7XHC5_9HYPH